jgi:adenylate cyclase
MSNVPAKILVVDDDGFVRDLLSCILESYGYVVATAENGALGYNAYVSSPDFDLIVLDMDMPVMTGLEMMKLLQQNGFDVPILILTGNMDINVAIDAMKNGAGDYILKREDIHDTIILAVENVLEKKRLREQNKSLEQMVMERTGELNASLARVQAANRLIRQTFGRYLSDEVVEEILASPDGAGLSGETRVVTIMMTDLRGFTAISERLPAKDVLGIINIYLEMMTDIIFAHKGTIIEFVGDAILAVFGAPVLLEDDAERAVACAIRMQAAIPEVNARLRSFGFPEIEQGIGLNCGECIVGNIGSDRRIKYGVTGMNVTLAARIESYTTGGQVLVSESVVRACGPILVIKEAIEVMPKGVSEPLNIFDVQGIGGRYDSHLPAKTVYELMPLPKELPAGFFILDGKHLTRESYAGAFVSLNAKGGVVSSAMAVERLADLKFSLFNDDGGEVTADLYAKVVESAGEADATFKVHFTSIPPEAENHITAVLAAL